MPDTRNISAVIAGSEAWAASSDIAIIGMAGRFPGARTVDEFWRNLCDGVESITHFTAEELLQFGMPSTQVNDPHLVKANASLLDFELFDAEFFGYHPKEAEIMDPQHRILLECAWEALENAGHFAGAFDGVIGVYAGAAANTYLLFHLAANPAVTTMDRMQINLGNAEDFVATRISYKLNLSGPSLSVRTACSTSLVAVHLACQSLLNRECDMALAGGVAVNLSQRFGYHYLEGGIVSPDGHCRPFDAQAQGTIFGSGVGMVVLKRLTDAVNDGNSIVAVIKGSATNNDGSAKVGYTAPSVNGQAEVVAEAQAVAGINPETIRYIEAHGTGTVLGDPIEIEALTKVFRARTQAAEFCAIGSVKSNIGHLDAAAGIASLIKTALILKHRQIPPSLHFKQPNPQIDFARSPFYVNTRLAVWPVDSSPARAAVSSFGIGGTNAHVILEEPPRRPASLPVSSNQLLLLSAKTAAALESATDRLAAHLAAHPDLELADVAYTLQVGRESFPHRRAVICDDVQKAVRALKERDAESVWTTHVPASTERRVAFLFPRPGLQYLKLASDLYDHSVVFRDEVDSCCEALQPVLKCDLRAAVFSNGNRSDAGMSRSPLTLPAVFIAQIALARLMIALGVRPSALLGEGIGEWIAGYQAGVFVREELLELAVKLGSLIQMSPEVSMLEVDLPASEAADRLSGSLALDTYLRSSRCTVSGPADEICDFEKKLASGAVRCRRVDTIAAFQTSAADAIAAEVNSLLQRMNLRVPGIPLISSVRGTWIGSAEATNPDYWAGIVRQKLHLDASFRALRNDDSLFLLELAPDHRLTEAAGQYLPTNGSAIVNVIAASQKADEGQMFLWRTLARIWLGGVEPEWPKMHEEERRRRVPMPAYPFDRKRYWIEADPGAVYARNCVGPECGRKLDCPPARSDGTKEEVAMAEPPKPQPEASTRQARIVESLKEILVRLSGVDASILDVHANFSELGFDSLLLLQMNQAIGDRFHVSLSLRQLFEKFPTLTMLATLIDSQLPCEGEEATVVERLPVRPSEWRSHAPRAANQPVMTTVPLSPESGAPAEAERVTPVALGDVLLQQMQLMTQQIELLQKWMHGSQDASGGGVHGPKAQNLLTAQPPMPRAAAPSNGARETFVAYQHLSIDNSQVLGARQQEHLERLTARYTGRTRNSRDTIQKYRSVLANNRNVAGFRLPLKEMVYQIVAKEAAGSRFRDVDNHEYIDISMGFGVYLFGHNAQFIREAVEEELRLGAPLGPFARNAGAVAQLIHEFTGVERVAFFNSGTEAVMVALRLARAATGRTKIAIFAGSFHGTFDGILARADFSSAQGHSLPLSPGVPGHMADHVLVLDYGSPEALDTIRANAQELAAVLVEPVQSRRPDFQPGEFLKELRTLTAQRGVALVFDEVITGFRIGPGGAQAHFGVEADLVTYGKIIGGGLPVGVVAGKARYMDGIDGGMWRFGDMSYPEREHQRTFVAGTFCQHPMAMAAANAVLRHLQAEGPALQDRLNERTAYLTEALDGYFRQYGVPIHMVRFGSLFRFVPRGDLELLFYHLIEKGIYIWEGRNCFLSTAHTDQDIEGIIRAVQESVEELRAGDFLPARATPAGGNGLTMPAAMGLGSSTAASTALGSDRAVSGPPRASSFDAPLLVPLTEGQKELWVLSQLSAAASSAYNEAIILRLRGRLNIEMMRRSLQSLFERHEALRTVIDPDGETQRVFPPYALEIPLLALTESKSEADRADEIKQLIVREGSRPFDLAQGPLVRVCLIQSSAEEHLMVFVVHHIIADDWSRAVLLEELGLLYAAGGQGAAGALPEAVPFRAFVEWQKFRLEQGSRQSLKAREYWQELFALPLTSLELPTDRSRRGQEHLGARLSIVFPISLYGALKRLSAQENTTVFVVLLSAFAALLHNLSSQPDILIAVPSTGQPQMGAKSLVGQCITMLPFYSPANRDKPFVAHLRDVRGRLFDALEYQEQYYALAGERQRNGLQLPALTVMFNMDRMVSVPSFGDMKADLVPFPISHVKFDLSLNCIEIDEELQLQFDYRKDLFDGTTISFWASCFEAFLRNAVDRPEAILGKLLTSTKLSGEEEGSRELPRAVAPAFETLLRRFEQQVQLCPETPAIITRDFSLNYRELGQQADQFAEALTDRGLRAGQPVAMALEHPADAVRCFLGAAKAGLPCCILSTSLRATLQSEALGRTSVCMIMRKEGTRTAASMDPQELNWEMGSGTADSLRSGSAGLAEVLVATEAGQPHGISQRTVLERCDRLANALQLGEGDRLWSLDGLSSDLMLSWILPALLSGASLVFEEQLEPSLLNIQEYAVHAGITVLDLPMATLRQLVQLADVERPGAFPAGLRCLVRSSTPVASGQLHCWGKEVLGDSRLWFGYRPAQSPWVVAITEAQAGAEIGESRRCQIGIPFSAPSCSVRDEPLQEVLSGVIGRLCVEAEVPPASSAGHGGAPLVLTDERGRFKPNGAVEVLGRVSARAIVRGRAVELMEIAGAVMEYPEVRDAVVLSRKIESAEESRLVVYFVAVPGKINFRSGNIDGSKSLTHGMRNFLRGQLPDYMQPASFVVLEQLPMLPDGTVDQDSLPAPISSRFAHETEGKPHTPVEERLAAIWSRVLRMEEIGTHENFFELGGHSLLAIMLAAEIQSTFSLKLTLRDLFDAPTIGRMSALIETRAAAGLNTLLADAALPAIKPQKGSLDAPFPLTDVQQAYWVGRSGMFGLGNVSTHTYYEVETDSLDIERFERAWQAMIERHGMLRAVVLPHGEQRVLTQPPPYKFKIFDFSSLAEEAAMASVQEIRERMSHQVLPSDQWPLFEICVSRLGSVRLRLHISIDALIVDAWSMQILFQELSRLYSNPGASLPPLALTFRDYVLGERQIEGTEIYRKSLEYWKRRLSALSPAPDLPLLRDPESLTKPRFVRWAGRLDATTWNRLKTRAARKSITPSIVLLAAYAEVLTLWSKSPQFTLNVTLFNRLPLHPEVDEIVGDFTSVTLLSVDNTAADTFSHRAQRIQEQFWEDLEHRYVSGVRVLRDLARMRRAANGMLMPVVFTSSLIHGEGDMETSPMSWLGNVMFSITQTPQVWLDHEVYEDAGSLVFTWDVVAELFPEGFVDQMFTAFTSLLKRLSSDEESWSAAWPEVARQLLPEAHLEMVARVNATKAVLPVGLLHTLFAEQAAQRPERDAIVTSSRSFTYRETAQRANQVGHWLRRMGAQVNTLVAIVMAKGWEQVVAALGVLHSGAAYLPIDPGLPRERILYLLEHGQVSLVLTLNRFSGQFDWPAHIRCLSLDSSELEENDTGPLESIQSPEDLAYVIFTSGSTGLPKGVMIDHCGAVNTILDLNRRYKIGSEDRVLALSSLSFDLSVYDIFGLLAAGGTVVIPDAWATRDPAHWAELIVVEQVTIWNSVPTLMEMLVEHAESRHEVLSSSLRLIFMSGDWLPVTLPDRIGKLLPRAHLVSMGGATEASIWSILYDIEHVDPEWKSIPYGKAMLNQTFYVLDQHLELRPTWIPGQLYIGGIGLAKGYWRDQDKTQVSFITHPRTGERLYRTGDLGRYLPDGNIEFLGREDYQVKVQGHRIELGEIETTLAQHPKVRAAAVAAVGEQRGNKRLIAYIVPYSNNRQSVEAHFLDVESAKTEDLATNPLARLRFKLAEPGLRQDAEFQEIYLAKPDLNDVELNEHYIQRRSYRSFQGQRLTFEQMGHLLACLQQRRIARSPLPKYLYGSAGSLYPVQLYVYIKPAQIEGIEGGTYYYHPRNHSLVCLSNSSIQRAIYDPDDQPQFDEAAFALFLVSNVDVAKRMYGEDGKKYAAIEAGLITQLLETQAVSHGIGLCQIGSLDFDAVRDLFALSEGHAFVHSLVSGPISQYQRSLLGFLDETRKYQDLVEMMNEDDTPVQDGELVSSQDDLLVEIKRWLEQKLPEYMVPSRVLILDSLPLSSNGKVDRSALPLPEEASDSANVYVAPRTDLERDIVRLLQEVLGTERIGVHDNFFDLGGNSVHLIQFHNRLQRLIGDQKISVTAMFRHVTVSSMAEYLGRSGPQTVEDRGEALSAGKERLELLHKRRSV